MTNKHKKVWKVISRKPLSGKQTQQKKKKNTFLETKPNFSLTGKCFPLTNFSNDKQIQENLKSNFPETTFQKQTWY